MKIKKRKKNHSKTKDKHIQTVNKQTLIINTMLQIHVDLTHIAKLESKKSLRILFSLAELC